MSAEIRRLLVRCRQNAEECGNWDLAHDITLALAAPAEPPVLKSVRSLDDGKLLAQFYDYTYFEDVMRLLAAPAVPASPLQEEKQLDESFAALMAYKDEPEQDDDQNDQARGPSPSPASPTGSRRSPQPDGSQRRLPWRLGCMADAMVSAKVGPQARFFSRERVDEIVLLLREAEKFMLEGR